MSYRNCKIRRSKDAPSVQRLKPLVQTFALSMADKNLNWRNDFPKCLAKLCLLSDPAGLFGTALLTSVHRVLSKDTMDAG